MTIKRRPLIDKRSASASAYASRTAIDRGITHGMRRHASRDLFAATTSALKRSGSMNNRGPCSRGSLGVSVAHRRRAQGHSSIDLELDAGIAQPIVPEVREDTDT